MRPTQHPSNNDVLLPPPGVGHDECRPLAITRVVYSNGQRAVWSYWEPTADERAAIAAGASIWLSAYGLTHPPVLLGVDVVNP